MHPSKWSLLQFSSDMNYLLVVYLLSCMDSSLLSNIQKLFYERIEVFSAVDFSKLSIVTGIIKIVLKVQYIKNALFHTRRSTNTHIHLKALLECVRLRTFGKFGLQQMQVDAHYLQVYLWRFVSDEQ